MKTPAEYLRLFNAAVCVCAAAFSCAVTETSLTTRTPLIKAITGKTVYVSEPVAFNVKPIDTVSEPLTYTVHGLPENASVNSNNGAFSWRPLLSDTGVHTAVFRAASGNISDSVKVDITVIMPTVSDSQVVRILRPSAGETYTYGDTLMVAFATIGCSEEAVVSVRNVRKTACDYTTTALSWLQKGVDSVDVRGLECRYLRSFPEKGINIGFYKMVLRDTTTTGTINFGGDTATVDSVRIKIYDPYPNHRIGSCMAPLAFQVLASGVSSGYFKVKPAN